MRQLMERLEVLNEKVADEILKQLGGGRRLSAFIGARDFYTDGKNSLVFKFPNKKKSGPNYVKITLNGKDLYDVTFSRIGSQQITLNPEEKAAYKKAGVKIPKESTVKVVKKYHDLYNDQLVDIFEKTTGLFLHL